MQSAMRQTPMQFANPSEKTPGILTEDDVRELIRAACDAAGGQSAWGRFHNIDPKEISLALRTTRSFSPALLAALGLRKKTVFVAEQNRT